MPSGCGAIWGQRIKRDPLAGAAPVGRRRASQAQKVAIGTEQRGDLIRALLVETPDITLPELKERLAKSGHS